MAAQPRLSHLLNHLNKPKRYAIFICGPHLPNSVGDYGDMFIRLLSTKNDNIIFDKFIVYNSSSLPSFAHIVTYYDGIFLTGSRFDAHSDDKWCVELRALIRSIYEYNLKEHAEVDKTKIIKMIGICFGHQLIAHALNGKSGRNNKGIWELGIKKISPTPAFSEVFKGFADVKALNVLQVHRDAVLALPTDATLLAYSSKTDVEMYCIDDIILCMQGHPEVNKEYVCLIVDTKLNDDQSVPREEIKYELQSMNDYTPNNEIFKRLILEFLQK